MRTMPVYDEICGFPLSLTESRRKGMGEGEKAAVRWPGEGKATWIWGREGWR